MKEKNLEDCKALQFIIDSTNDTIWNLDLITNEYFVQFRDKDTYGSLTNKKITDKKSWSELLHPDDKEKVIHYLSTFINGDEDTYKNIYRIKIKNNEYRYILSRGKAWRDKTGKMVRVSGNHIDITENYELRKKVDNLAYFDQITGLPNIESAKQYFEKTSKISNKFTFIYVEINDFKSLNILWEKEIVNNVLRNTGQLLIEHFKKESYVTKIRENAFLILFNNDKENFRMQMGCLNKLYQNSHFKVYHDIHLKFISGISEYSENCLDFDQLLKRAQIASYMGLDKNDYSIFDSKMSKDFENATYLTREIEKAIKSKEFEVYYQPIIDTKTQLLVGLEALLRWNHHKRGYVSPIEFIPIAESSGQMINLEILILNIVFSQINKWASIKDLPLFVSINLSSKGLLESNLVEIIEKFSEQYNVCSSKVMFEITETSLINELDSVINTLNILKKKGYKISLDDFGVGYSSLNYIRKLPIDKLKIDKSFIMKITDNNKDKVLLDYILKLGHSLNLGVVAEGIETIDQYNLLKKMKCDYIQGFYYGKPMNTNEIENWIETNYIKTIRNSTLIYKSQKI